MDWNAGTDWLMRLVSLLLSLADCAAYAARRSNRVRRNVLAALCPAEAAAFRIIVGAASHYGAPIPAGVIVTSGDWTAVADSDDPDAALLLADRFRALALALSFIAAWADYFARRLTAPGHTPWRGWQCSAGGLASWHDAVGELNDLTARTRAPP
jgi:hypothetical protein